MSYTISNIKNEDGEKVMKNSKISLSGRLLGLMLALFIVKECVANASIQNSYAPGLPPPANYVTTPVFPDALSDIITIMAQGQPPLKEATVPFWKHNLLMNGLNLFINNPFKSITFTLVSALCTYYFYQKICQRLKWYHIKNIINEPNFNPEPNEANQDPLLSHYYLPQEVEYISDENYIKQEIFSPEVDDLDSELPGGFSNEGNTCFINAAISCLLKNETIRTFLLDRSLNEKSFVSSKTKELQTSLNLTKNISKEDTEQEKTKKMLINELEDNKRKTKLRGLLHQLALEIGKTPHATINTTLLVNYFKDDINIIKAYEADDSLKIMELCAEALPELFEFHQLRQTRYECSTKPHKIKDESLYVLPLSPTGNGSSLKDSLTNFFALELAENLHEHCLGKKCSFIRQLDLSWETSKTAPQFIAINLKATNHTTQSAPTITIPQIITLSGLNPQNKTYSEVKYQLCSLIKLANKHFKSLVKTKDGWYEFNDSSTTKISNKDLKKLLKNNDTCRGAMYQRIEEEQKI